MKVVLLITLLASFASSQITDTMHDWRTDSSMGHLPEIIVTAPRYEHEDVAWSGLMETVVVTAPRFIADESDFTAATYSTNNIHHDKEIISSGNPRNHENILPRYTDVQYQLLPSVLPFFLLTIIGFFLVLHRNNKPRRMAKKECTGNKCTQNVAWFSGAGV